MTSHGYKLQNTDDTLEIMYHLLKSMLSELDANETQGFDVVELAMLYTLWLIGLVDPAIDDSPWEATSKLKSLAYDSEEFLRRNRGAVVYATKEPSARKNSSVKRTTQGKEEEKYFTEE